MSESVFRDAADAENDACVLHGVVRIKKPRADRADFGPLHMFRHQRQPFTVDHFDVVIQEEQPGAGGLFDREVVQRREIKRASELQNPMSQMSEIIARFLGFALVVDHDDLVVQVARFGRETGDATREQINADRASR